MKRTIAFLFLVVFSSSCITYTPLREREIEEGWIHLDDVLVHEFATHGEVVICNQIRACWAYRIEDETLILTTVDEEDRNSLSRAGWRISNSSYFNILTRRHLKIQLREKSWSMLYRYKPFQRRLLITVR